MKRFLAIIACICLVAAGVSVAGWLPRHKLYSVQTASMGKAVPQGSLILVRASKDVLKPGIVASYVHPLNNSMIVTHRIVAYDAATRTYTFQGDSNRSPDIPIPVGQVVGPVSKVVPGAGHVVTLLKTPLGLLIGVYLPGSLIIMYEVGRVMLHRRSYRLNT